MCVSAARTVRSLGSVLIVGFALALGLALAPARRSSAQYRARARVGASDAAERRGRAGSTVSRRQREERLPRSTPDALRYEPGLYVQQTGHAQASPFVRGLTGQQVVHVFDGIRLNNGLYRQGPNQYFFTVDALTVSRLTVVRGSASVLYGSDAIGGAILATPIEPELGQSNRLELRPRLFGRFASADLERGGRAQIEGSSARNVAVLAGAGYRTADELRAGGIVYSPVDGSVPQVPRFGSDGATQLGTGFSEATFDARVVGQLRRGVRVLGAVYGYRGFDAPRTDQCAPPFAPANVCLNVEEQFRTLGYVAIRGDAGLALRDLDLNLSFQRQHERRVLNRPSAFARNVGRDDVDTLGISFRAETDAFQVSRTVDFGLRYGFDAYRDAVSSAAWITLTDSDRTFAQSRGQYIGGSSYASAGMFTEAALSVGDWLTLRSGGRVAAVGARAPSDPESGTRAVSHDTTAIVGRAGAEARVSDAVTLYGNLDQGFRSPNLDDLTSRQQAGPGFQFENADLEPERSITAELGTQLDTDALRLEIWGFFTRINGAMTRSLRDAEDCPPETPQCAGSWSRYQLVNAARASRIFGAESLVRIYLPYHLDGRATFAWAFGQGPNAPTDSTHGDEEWVPLSRIPPVNGTVELRWSHRGTGIYLGGALRWALAQTRLAPSDRSDSRIPTGGTPGYAVTDLRAGWRLKDRFQVALAFENLADTAYRVHGSSVNGPGRGVSVFVSGGL